MKPRVLKKIHPDDITLLNRLGEGNYGTVYKATFKGTTCAVKYIDIVDLFYLPDNKKYFIAELNAYSFFKNKNVKQMVQFYGVVTLSYYGIVMEYMPAGDMEHHIDGGTHFSRKSRYNIMMDVLKGIHFMHKHDLLHGDIKPSNILLTSNLHHARLCDFGFSMTCDDAKNLLSRHGTPVYSAPELYLYDTAYITKATDMYSLGMTFWGFISKKIPFDHLISESELYVCKLSGMPLTIPKRCSVVMAGFFKACWDVNPDDRLTTKEALSIVRKARDCRR